MFFRNTLSPYFDPFTYLQLNEDVRLSGVDPVQHFLKFGRKEGRRYRLEGQGDVGGFLSKVQLCGLLSAKFDLKKYLEITTTTTGNQYSDTAVFGFTDRKRLVYRHAGTISDGLPIDYSSTNDDISECLQKLKQSKAAIDLILVDPHHTYDSSYRVISEAFSLLEPGGAMVVHDCRPPNEAMATPEFIPGPWCGVTYRAYVDFVLANPHLDYCTVICDFGCGIILKPKTKMQLQRCSALARKDSKLRAQWDSESKDPQTIYRNFRTNEVAFLRLVDFAGLRTKLNQVA